MSDLSHERVRAYLQIGHASLTSDEQAAVDDHLRDCAECRAYADHVARLQAALTQTLHQRWDTPPVPKFAARVLPRLRKSKLPQQVFSYAIGLGALAALILLLQAFFTIQLQYTAQSPLTDATSAPPLVPTAITVTPVDARPTPTPIQIALLDSAAIKVSRVSFWPDQSVVFDRNISSDFGLEMQADTTISTTVHVVAYGLRSDELLPDCLTRSVPTDRPFWSNQADYAAGAITFDQHFLFADEQVGADRFLVRLSVLDAAANDRLLYCAQQVYAVSINVTPAPPTPAPAFTATPAPYPLDTSALGPIETSFWPDPSLILDGPAGFSFGAVITTTSQISVIAQMVAFPVWPISWNDNLTDCARRETTHIQPIWTNQAIFAPGQIVYSQSFNYANDMPDATRLVVRINLIEAGGSDRLLYCTQQVYRLLPDNTPTPTPTSDFPPFTPEPTLYQTPTPPPLPPTPAPTATPGPVLTPTPYEPPVVMPITDRDVAIQLALQADRNWVQREHPITMEMIATDPTIVTVQRFVAQAESGFGVNATIADGPVWVVTLKGRGLATVIGIGGGASETNEVLYEFLERTGTLLGTSVKPIAPTSVPSTSQSLP